MRERLKATVNHPFTGLVFFALLAGMILSAHVQRAWAYFTTYAQAKGGYTLHLGDTTSIDEHFSDWKKIINITNSDDSQPVWVRAKAFSGAEYQDYLEYRDSSSDPSRWEKRGEGDALWYYYKVPLGAGESTGSFDKETGVYKGLVISMNKVPDKVTDGTEFNVVVVYETTPVLYNSKGDAYADWEGKVDAYTVTSEEDQKGDAGYEE